MAKDDQKGADKFEQRELDPIEDTGAKVKGLMEYIPTPSGRNWVKKFKVNKPKRQEQDLRDLISDAMGKIEAIDEPGSDEAERRAVKERSGEFYARLGDYIQQPEQRLRLTALNYASRTGDADWRYQILMFADEGYGMDWAEAERQASLIAHRISELTDDEDDREGKARRDARREAAFLNYYAREELLPLYAAGGSAGPGIPDDLVYILRCKYLGDEAVMGYLQHEIKKPMTKLVALGVVRALPLASEGQLALVFNVEKSTIKNWAPDLKAAGWAGTQQKTADTAKPQKTPKRREPGMPKLRFMQDPGPEDD